MSLSLEKLQITGTTASQVLLTYDYVGDSNDNSVITVYICSLKKQAACNPLTGNAISFNKANGQLHGTINLASTEITPGDMLKYQIISSDSDGLTGDGGTESGYIIIPYDSSAPKSFFQLGQTTYARSGASDLDNVNAMARDSSGNIYLAGETSGNLGGPLSGGTDAFIAKIDSNGNLVDNFGVNGIWQLGRLHSTNTGDDSIDALFVDSNDNLFAAGTTSGALGGSNAGSDDVFILKLNSSTSALDLAFGNGDGTDGDGITQLNANNTASAAGNESVANIVVESGSIYLVGYTVGMMGGAGAGSFDGFIAKINSNDGQLNSTFGDGDGADDDGIVQINASNVADATGADFFTDILIASDGSILVAGNTSSAMGGPNAGSNDVIILKMDNITGLFDADFGDGDGTNNDGALQFNATNTTNATSYDGADSITEDNTGNLYILGITLSSIGGANAGGYDSFVAKFDLTHGILDASFGDGDGTDNDGITQLNATNTLSAFGSEFSNEILATTTGHVYIRGTTANILGGAHGGNVDTFIAKLDTTNGLLDSDFGDGDGNDNDGIVQFNATNTADTTLDERSAGFFIDDQSRLLLSGYTTSSLGGINAGGSDIFIARLNTTSGALDTSFGGGDGASGDGIRQMNDGSTARPGNTSRLDYINTVALDGSGNLYIAGFTNSALGADNPSLQERPFVAKVNSANGALDTDFGDGDGADNDGIVQLNDNNTGGIGTSERIEAIAVDASGNLFIVGQTFFGTPGGANGGGRDTYIAKMDVVHGQMDSDFGDGDGTDNDGIVQLNNVNTADATSNDVASTLNIDTSGNIYVGGNTVSDLGGVNAGAADLFIVKLNGTSGLLDGSFGDGDGTDNDGVVQLNTTNTGSAAGNETMVQLTLDTSGNIFAVAYTNNVLSGSNAGGSDTVVIKMDRTSGVLDTTFGDGDGTDNDGIVQLNAANTADASGQDYSQGIALDASGDIYIIGETTSNMGGTNSGDRDVFIAKFDNTSGLLDSDFGDNDGTDNDGIALLNSTSAGDAAASDSSESILIDISGNIYIAGITVGALGGTQAGSGDAFVAKLEPTNGTLISSFGSGDGTDNDGITQINTLNSQADASQVDIINSMVLGSDGYLYGGGYTESSLGEVQGGDGDVLIIRLNSANGQL